MVAAADGRDRPPHPSPPAGVGDPSRASDDPPPPPPPTGRPVDLGAQEPSSGDRAGGAPDTVASGGSDGAASAPLAAGALPKGSTADLWAFALDSPIRAQEALLAAMRLAARKQLGLVDAAIVARVRGRLRITQTRHLTVSQGAIGGAWLGILVGLFLGPGGPLVGAAVGAAAGGLLARLRHKGIDDAAMKRLAEPIGPDEAALFLLVDDCHRMRALQEVARFPGRIVTSTADPDLVETVRGRFAVDPWS